MLEASRKVPAAALLFTPRVCFRFLDAKRLGLKIGTKK
jgi:hypothetical protein